MSAAHTIIGLAVATSMKMGLHSRASCEGLSSLEKDLRRRIFWTLVKLDLYSGTVLGFPSLINMDYVDQPKPSGQPQDYANEEQGGVPSIITRRTYSASAQCLEILIIIGKMVQRLYPNSEDVNPASGKTKMHQVSSAVISEIEENFKTWRDGLQEALGFPEQNSTASAMYKLEMVYNFGHILLYRPFLHYLAKTNIQNPPDPRYLRCAHICVKISRSTISRSEDMLRQGFLAPTEWQSVYTIFLSLVTLLFFLATQHGTEEYAAIQKDTETGIRLLARTSCQDIGSRKCLDVLRVLANKWSHVVNVDVDRVCLGEESACKSLHRGTPTRNNSSTSQSRKNSSTSQSRKNSITSHSSAPAVEQSRPQQQTRISNPVPPSQTPPPSSGQQQFAYRPQPVQRQITPVNPHPGSLPMYQAPGMPFTGQMPLWDQSIGGPAPTHSIYLQRPPFVYGTPPPPVSDNTEPYGAPSEMEVPFPNGFAWPYEMSSEQPRERQGGPSQSHPPSVTLPLTDHDLDAFMRINPGEGPFL